jgi:ABC-type branched-subunit amino acid transport system substrate-binding protein
MFRIKNVYNLILFCCFTIALTSCDVLKNLPLPTGLPTPSQKPTPIPEDKRKSTDVTTPVDTIVWKDQPMDKFPPITSSGNNGGNTSNGTPRPTPADKPTNDNTGDINNVESGITYKIAMILPFLGDKLMADGSYSDKSKPTLDFYAGAKMAFEQLEKEGISLKINVFDTKASEAETQNIFGKREVRKADLIIGPVRTANLRIAAPIVKENRVPMVVPLNPSDDITTDNPYYIQATPSLKSHCEAIMTHARKKFRPEQIVLVCRNKPAEVERLKYFQNTNAAIDGAAATKIKEFVISDESAELSKTDLLPYIKGAQPMAFIIPSWSSEAFIHAFLRKLGALRRNNIAVYGMPQWMEYENIELELLDRGNIYVSSAGFQHPNSPELTDFKRAFFQKYGKAPDTEALSGYDVTTYFGRLLNKRGVNFLNVLEQEPAQMLGTSFNFQRVFPDPTVGGDASLGFDRYENKSIYILRFKDSVFQPE